MKCGDFGALKRIIPMLRDTRCVLPPRPPLTCLQSRSLTPSLMTSSKRRTTFLKVQRPRRSGFPQRRGRKYRRKLNHRLRLQLRHTQKQTCRDEDKQYCHKVEKVELEEVCDMKFDSRYL